jgi:hypothetical protein
VGSAHSAGGFQDSLAAPCSGVGPKSPILWHFAERPDKETDYIHVVVARLPPFQLNSLDAEDIQLIPTSTTVQVKSQYVAVAETLRITPTTVAETPASPTVFTTARFLESFSVACNERCEVPWQTSVIDLRHLLEKDEQLVMPKPGTDDVDVEMVAGCVTFKLFIETKIPDVPIRLRSKASMNR